MNLTETSELANRVVDACLLSRDGIRSVIVASCLERGVKDRSLWVYSANVIVECCWFYQFDKYRP